MPFPPPERSLARVRLGRNPRTPSPTPSRSGLTHPGPRLSQLAFIRGAINLPAHSFHPTLPSLIPLLVPYKRLVFHCQSSSGRGPRCAGWLQDALNELPSSSGEGKPEALVLTGGIKGWYEAYGEDESVTVRISGLGWKA